MQTTVGAAAPSRAGSHFFFFQAEDGIRDYKVTGVQTYALPIFRSIWTTFGPWADWIFVLARTDQKDRYGGISFILAKLDTPGITMRPLRQITGESEFGEVFFEDARVPRENLVGRIGEGWRIAMTVLAFERGALSLAAAERYGRDLRLLAGTCKEIGRESAAVREKLGRLLVETEVLRANGLRMLANLADGKVPGPESSIEKVFWSE